MKQWLYDKRRRIYVDRQGVRLTEREIRDALDEYISSVQEGMAERVVEYTAGAITTKQLFSFLEDEVTALHGASGAIAYGGLPQMDSEKWGRIESRLVTEWGYLNQFQSDVQTAAQSGELSAEGIANRAGLYGEAAYSEYMNQVVERETDHGVTLGRRICEADGASCDDCVDAATEDFIPLDDIPEIGTLQCLNNCVVAGTMMGGRFLGGLKAFYTGEIINIRTASGKSLTITPNHPVLTEYGFIKAGLLQQGDYLISEGAYSEPSATLDDQEQGPAPIEQILASLAERGWVGTIRSSPIDLHGDGRYVQSEIEIVATDGVLLDDGPTPIGKGNREIILKSADKFPGLKASLRPVREFSLGSMTAPHCFPSGSGLTLSGFQSFLPRQMFSLTTIPDADSSRKERSGKSPSGNTSSVLQLQHTGPFSIPSNSSVNIDSIVDSLRPSLPPKEQSFGLAANVDVALSKPAAEDARADAVFLRQLRERFPGFVATDPVTEITRHNVLNEHVYDLSTDVGWQSANGIIISNCRCEIEFQIGDTEFRPSEIFTGVIGGQDAFGGSVEIN
jgi:hypothetical protein